MRLPPAKEYPKKILVNNEYYQIKFVRKIKTDDAKHTVGLCDPTEHIISIRDDLSSSETFTTFVHELLHAIEFEYNLTISHKTIYALEVGVVNLLLNNF